MRDDDSRMAGRIASRVRELSDTFLAHRTGAIAVIEAYLDETGTHLGSQIIGVSVVWADKAAWYDWTLDWLAAKAPIKMFHAVDCSNRDREYLGWTKSARDAHVLKLLPVVEGHYICGVFAGFDKQELIRLVRAQGATLTEKEMERGWYFMSLTWALKAAFEKNSYLAKDETIAFVHETNDYVDLAYRAFAEVSGRNPERLCTFSLGSKIAYPPLQCADLLAYEGNKQLRNFSGPLRKPLLALDKTGTRFSFRKYDADEVAKLVDFVKNFQDALASV